jgi:hypothetical protein
MRIQFLVSAHRDPEFVWRLCDRLLRASDVAVMVQWDSGFEIPRPPAGLDVTIRPTRAPSGWGNYGQLDASVDSLLALEAEPFDWLIALSGQDYPLRAPEHLERFLASTPHALFVRLDEPEPVAADSPSHRDEWTYVHDRYFRQYGWVPDSWWRFLSPSVQRSVSGAAKMTVQAMSRAKRLRLQRRPRGFSPGLGVAVRRHPFTPERPCRKGADWFAMSRPVFDDLVGEIRGAPELLAWFRRTYIPTESFLHTLLLPTWEPMNAGTNLQFVRFGPNRAHPDVLTRDDWHDLVASGEFFARKFDPADQDLLDRIDSELLSAPRSLGEC